MLQYFSNSLFQQLKKVYYSGDGVGKLRDFTACFKEGKKLRNSTLCGKTRSFSVVNVNVQRHTLSYATGVKNGEYNKIYTR